MMSAAELQAYVNLITWPVVALLGGMVFGPALYVMAFRTRRVSIFGASAELTRDEAREAETEAELQVQERVTHDGASAVTAAAQDLEEISDDAGPKEEMYKNVVQAQLTLAAIVRSLAEHHGGESNLRAFKRNVEILRNQRLVPRDEIDRLLWFYDRRFEFRREPSKLTSDTYKRYMRRARRTANRLSKHVRNGSFAPPLSDLNTSSSLPN